MLLTSRCRRDAVADRAGFFHVLRQDQRAPAGEALGDDFGARHGGQQAVDFALHGVEVGGVGAQQDGLGQFVVFGLAEQSIATQSGGVVPSASTRISLGPAIMSMPTVPNTRFWRWPRRRCRGR